ncbi:MAG: carboxylating nicotinate-nucleotide diphosphorylase [Actinobacteria bacterium]|nr:carboxylating nicotinate-nucleotide diphosphorylase [Actinomycetota bacterium]
MNNKNLNKINRLEIENIIKNAIKEDLGAYGDITSKYIFGQDDFTEGYIICKEKGGAVLCGIDVAKFVFEEIDCEVKFNILKNDGDYLNAGDKICEITGRTLSILKSERVSLNFIQHLSGIATITGKFTEIASKYGIKITETRKTLPNLRILEKYAVRCGGGSNHRFGLFDGILIKDNHLAAAGGVSKAINLLRNKIPHTLKIEVEIKNRNELIEAIESKADIIMLDNMGFNEMAESVKMIREKLGDRCKIEASGNVRLDTLEEICKTGVDLISSGAITNSAKAVDFSLEFGN